MNTNTTKLYWLHILSPVHVGTGRGVGYIDLPLHRDKVTNWPLIPGSALKGVWADSYRATDTARKENKELALAFGRASDSESNQSNAGALIATDAKLVCLPVRSLYGTFAWCTSPLALQYLRRDLECAGQKDLPPSKEDWEKEKVYQTQTSCLSDQGKIYLEDLDLQSEVSEEATQWAQKISQWVFPDDAAWQNTFQQRFVILPNDVFDFLTETGTEVVTRTRIDENTKTVTNGALWSEENLPAESILAGLISCDRVYRKPENSNDAITEETLLQKFAKESMQLQIGGNATIGRGRIRCLFSAAKKEG
jgi:CRISPR-associated protein Cmr4